MEGFHARIIHGKEGGHLTAMGTWADILRTENRKQTMGFGTNGSKISKQKIDNSRKRCLKEERETSQTIFR